MSSPLCPLPPAAEKRVGPGIRRARELALPLIDYSTQESRPYTLIAQQTRAGSVVRGTGELDLKAGKQGS